MSEAIFHNSTLISALVALSAGYVALEKISVHFSANISYIAFDHFSCMVSVTTDGVVVSGTADDIFEGSGTTSLMIISFSGLVSKLLNNKPN